MLKVSYQKIEQFVTGKHVLESVLSLCQNIHTRIDGLFIANPHMFDGFFKRGDGLLVEGVGLAVHEVLFNAFDGIEKLRVACNIFTLQIEKLLASVSPDKGSLKAFDRGLELGRDKRSQFHALDLCGIQIQIRRVVKSQIFFQWLQVTMPDHHFLVENPHCQRLVGIENHCQNFFLGLDDQAVLLALFVDRVQVKLKSIGEICQIFDFNDLSLFGPLQTREIHMLFESVADFLSKLAAVLLPMGIIQTVREEGLEQFASHKLLVLTEMGQVIEECQTSRSRFRMILR